MPIIQESPSAKETRKRKKGLLTVGLTKQNLRSILRKESLRRKVSYGYEDNRRRRDWLVVRIRSLSEYKNGYFLLQRTNQRHSELVCYWPARKQRVESFSITGFLRFFFFNHSPTLLWGKFISSAGENHTPIPSHGSRRNCGEIPRGIPAGFLWILDRKGKSKNTGTMN